MKTNRLSKIKLLAVILIVIISSFVYGQKYENLALTPPMGWNTWNRFGCDVTEELIRNTADAMVSSGMRDAGYIYLVIDDCWQVSRDSLGFIQPDPKRFPSGMKALADYVHSKDLKFGLYSCAGDKTCAGRPGSRGHEYQDALQYAKWGVDYLKYDWCNTEGLRGEGAYTTMSRALKAAGRPVLFSLCDWGHNKPYEWAANVGHMWRTTGDIYNCFDCKIWHGAWYSWGVMYIVDYHKFTRKYAGPGHWNDPDMLEVGNDGLSVNENRAHFSIWCMLAAPLICGHDVVNMTKETAGILTNREAIAVNQDSLGVQGFVLQSRDSVEYWFKPLMDDAWAVCFLNRSQKPVQVNFDWKTKVYDDVAKRDLMGGQVTYTLRDIWAKKDVGNTSKPLVALVRGHDVLMLVLKKEEKKKKK